MGEVTVWKSRVRVVNEFQKTANAPVAPVWLTV